MFALITRLEASAADQLVDVAWLVDQRVEWVAAKLGDDVTDADETPGH